MAITFPNSPSNGDTHTSSNGLIYSYDGEKWTTAAIDSTTATTTISSNPPASASVGDLWFDSDNGELYVYYQDVDSSQWIAVSVATSVADGSIDTLKLANDSVTHLKVADNLLTSSGSSFPTASLEGQLHYDTTSGGLYIAVGSPLVWTIVGGAVEEAPTDGNQYARQNGAWSVVTGGGGGDTYSGASAWGNVDSTGTFLTGLNVASVTKAATGKYDVVFSTPMPNANYAVTGAGAENNGAGIFHTELRTATGFRVVMMNNAATILDFDFTFTVFSQNALPPKSGTGTDAWAAVNSSGVVESSFNCSVTKTGGGEYDVVFTTPMPTDGYAVSGSSDNGSDASAPRVFSYYSKSTTGFKIRIKDSTNSYSNEQFSFTVNATNATLPATVTQEQIESAINNPGASAWADVASDGSLNGGMNIASVNRTSTGVYAIAFNTPMPDDNYSITTSPSGPITVVVRVESRTSTGCVIEVRTTDNNSSFNGGFSLQVFATNALPPKGGTGTDAWGTVDKTISNGACNVPASFNVASVTRTGTGLYDVVFTTPMPTANYSIQLTAQGPSPEASGRVATYSDATVNGFSVDLRRSHDLDYKDNVFSFTVNATNAVLPQSFSEEQIQTVIDHAQSGVTNPGASAWGDVASDGTINGGLNIGSVTRTSAGKYSVVFATPLASSVYAPVINVSTETNVYALPNNQTATGFDVVVRDAAGTYSDLGFVFTVFATNAIPPKGGTGTDAWASVNADGTTNGTFNCTISRTDSPDGNVYAQALGYYYVTFNTPMPTADYSVTTALTDATYGVDVIARQKFPEGFWIDVRGSANGGRGDYDFDFQVNATNATLPASFTEAQIQSVIDSIGTPRVVAMASTNNYTAGGGDFEHNIASITRTSQGVFQATFTAALSSTNYVVTITPVTGYSSTSSVGPTAAVYNKTLTGFEIRTYGSSGLVDADVNFTVTAL